MMLGPLSMSLIGVRIEREMSSVSMSLEDIFLRLTTEE